MEKFIADITSLYWWLAVVIVGILINISSTYIRQHLENKLGKLSTYWANNKELRRNERIALLRLLQNDKTALIVYANSENRFRVRALSFLVLSLMFLFIGLSGINHNFLDFIPEAIKYFMTLCMLLVSSISILMAISDAKEAINIKTISNEVLPNEIANNT